MATLNLESYGTSSTQGRPGVFPAGLVTRDFTLDFSAINNPTGVSQGDLINLVRLPEGTLVVNTQTQVVEACPGLTAVKLGLSADDAAANADDDALQASFSAAATQRIPDKDTDATVVFGGTPIKIKSGYQDVQAELTTLSGGPLREGKIRFSLTIFSHSG